MNHIYVLGRNQVKKDKLKPMLFSVLKKYSGYDENVVIPDGVKVIGNAELSKKLNVKVNAYSASAKASIEAAGGTAEVAE